MPLTISSVKRTTPETMERQNVENIFCLILLITRDRSRSLFTHTSGAGGRTDIDSDTWKVSDGRKTRGTPKVISHEDGKSLATGLSPSSSFTKTHG